MGNWKRTTANSNRLKPSCSESIGFDGISSTELIFSYTHGKSVLPGFPVFCWRGWVGGRAMVPAVPPQWGTVARCGPRPVVRFASVRSGSIPIGEDRLASWPRSVKVAGTGQLSDNENGSGDDLEWDRQLAQGVIVVEREWLLGAVHDDRDSDLGQGRKPERTEGQVIGQRARNRSPVPSPPSPIAYALLSRRHLRPRIKGSARGAGRRGLLL